MKSHAAHLLGPKGPLAESLKGYEVREGQLAMARSVEDALYNSDVLLVEAGTGTGKTWAYLIPALLSGQRVLISTATKNLQEQIFGQDIPFLVGQLDIPVEVALLKGRSNYLCMERLENTLPPTVSDPNLEAYLTIERWSTETTVGDRSEVMDVAEDHPLWTQLTSTRESCSGSQCPYYDGCFVVQARRKAVQADILIINHHLFFADLAMKEVWDTGLIPNPEAIIFDEAHGLEDIACYFFGSSLSNWRLKELVRDVDVSLQMQGDKTTSTDALLRGVTGASERFFNTFQSFPEGTSRVTSENLPGQMEERKHELDTQLAGLGAHLNQHAVPGTPLATLEERTLRIRTALGNTLDILNTQQVHAVERRGNGVFLQDIPIRVSTELETGLYGAGQGIVFTSATMTTGGEDVQKAFQHFTERMGLDEGVEKKVVQSPFAYPEQALLYLPRDIPMPNDPDFAEAASKEALRLISLTKGATFLLFTSHRMLNIFHELMAPELEYPVFKQGNAPKERLLHAFKESQNGVLFGTSSFWEGVDVAGKALRSVIIDKLPFLSPGDPLIQARLEEIEERGLSSFKTYQLPTAILALKQGFGRLIRRKEDKGVVTILDPRVRRYGYGKSFLRALPSCPRVRDFGAVEDWVEQNMRDLEQSPKESSASVSGREN